MATGQKFSISLVANSSNVLTLGGISITSFEYDAGFNTTADIPLSSGGYLPPVNIPGSSALGGNTSAGDAAVVCNVRVKDNYSLNHTQDSYVVNFMYGASAVPLMTTTFAQLIAEAEFAIARVITDTNSVPQGTYAIGGGGEAVAPTVMSPTGPV